MHQGKSWAFTCFTYDEELVLQWQGKAASVELICFQEEKCPSSGRCHIQGFVRFHSNKRLGAVKSWLGDQTCHLEIAKGSPRANLDYCTKADSRTGEFRFQNGDFDRGGQGKRNDLHELTEAIREHKTMEELNDLFPREIIKYGRGIQLSRSLFLSGSAPVTFPRTVIVLWGRSGAGKSLWARMYAELNKLSVYSKNLSKSTDTQWFDGYDGESLLLLDDFTDQAVSFRELLIWTDIYKHRVQIKGAMSLGTWSHVIITSNVAPQLWYQSYVGAEREPLMRRLDHILEAPQFTFCDAAHDLHRHYIGRSPPVGINLGRPDESKSAGIESRGTPVPSTASNSEEEFCDPLVSFPELREVQHSELSTPHLNGIQTTLFSQYD